MLGTPVAGGPVEGLSLLDHFMESPADLFHRGEFIVEVGVEDVHVPQLQPLQALVDALMDVLAVGGCRRVQAPVAACLDLRRDDHVLSRYLQILQNFSQLYLRVAVCVDLSGVDVVDAVLEGVGNDGLVLFVVFGPAVDPVAQADD